MKNRRQPSGLSPLAEVLAKVLGERGMAGSGTAGRLISGWAEAVGESVAAHSSPDSLKGKTLYINVDSSAWMNQLSMLRLTLVERINAFLDEGAVEDVRFRIGKVVTPEARRVARAPFVPKRRSISPDEAEAIEGAVAGIADEGVRDGARKLMKAAYSRKP